MGIEFSGQRKLVDTCESHNMVNGITYSFTIRHEIGTMYKYYLHRKVWLISVCAYHSQWYGNMRLFDDVRLIGSEILALPTASMFKCATLRQQVMNSVIPDNSSVIVHGSMIRSHHWQKTGEK